MARKSKDEDELSPEEMDSDMKEALKDDAKFKQYRNIIKHIEKNYDLDALRREMQNAHEGRPSRALPRVPGPDAVLEASIKDGQTRSRLTRIMTDLVNQDGILDDALKAIRAHMVVTYSDMIPTIRTKTERVDYLNKYLRRGVKLKHNINTLMKIAALFVEDIDKMGYNFTNTVNILKIVYDSKGKQ